MSKRAIYHCLRYTCKNRVIEIEGLVITCEWCHEWCANVPYHIQSQVSTEYREAIRSHIEGTTSGDSLKGTQDVLARFLYEHMHMAVAVALSDDNVKCGCGDECGCLKVLKGKLVEYFTNRGRSYELKELWEFMQWEDYTSPEASNTH